jgi:hypothetical protein
MWVKDGTAFASLELRQEIGERGPLESDDGCQDCVMYWWRVYSMILSWSAWIEKKNADDSYNQDCAIGLKVAVSPLLAIRN